MVDTPARLQRKGDSATRRRSPASSRHSKQRPQKLQLQPRRQQQKKKVKPKRVQLPRDGAGTSASGLESDDDLNGGFDNFQDWPSEEKPEPEQLVARPRKKSPWHSIQSVEQASRVFANLSESDEGGEEEEDADGNDNLDGGNKSMSEHKATDITAAA